MEDLVKPTSGACSKFNQLHEFIEKEISKVPLDGCIDFGVPSSHQITSEWSEHGRVRIRDSVSKKHC